MHRTTREAEMHWGDDCGDGHTRHVQLHDDHEEEVQNNIDDAGQREKYRGRRVSPWARSNAAPKL